MIIEFSKLQNPNYSGDLQSVGTSDNNFLDPILEDFSTHKQNEKLRRISSQVHT